MVRLRRGLVAAAALLLVVGASAGHALADPRPELARIAVVVSSGHDQVGDGATLPLDGRAYVKPASRTLRTPAGRARGATSLVRTIRHLRAGARWDAASPTAVVARVGDPGVSLRGPPAPAGTPITRTR